MTVNLTDVTTGETLRLWNVQEFSPSVDVPEDVISPVGSGDASEAVLTVLEQDETITLSGRAVGLQIVRETGASDPETAAAQFAANLEAWVNDSPGTAGIALENTVSGRTVSCVPTSVSWERPEGAPDTVTFDVEVTVGGGVDGDTGIETPAVGPGGTDTFGGVTLPNVERRSVDRQISVLTANSIFADDAEDNEVFIEGGIVRRVTLFGTFVGSASEQRSFDDSIRALAGQGDSYAFASAFPGQTTEAALTSYEPTREAGITSRGDYVLEVVEGRAL